MKKLMFLLLALCLAEGYGCGSGHQQGNRYCLQPEVQPPKRTQWSCPGHGQFGCNSCLQKPSIYIKAVYGQPLKRGREVFGALEPYGRVWRTGANEATEITTTKDLRIGGKTLKAGTYTLFTIPQKDKWKVLFNSDLGQWGAFKYDPAKDVLVTEVPVSQTPETYEAFTIRFDETRTGADMVLVWDKTRVAVPLTFSR